ncbi:hypothetical protein AVEN_72592-1 [Araneus ventricosus]|uniref:Uncharacterized protein n=1 Tax=Araneus ventricosus TaxID=182803 RepID=A0A4Y2KMN7_ARAVE|nr:hypothetical protein AVEN_72592-1 [Araneus ventricosus]
MRSGKRRCGTQLVINNGKKRKLPVKSCVKSQKKKPKCSKTVCDPVANVKTVADNQALNNTGQNSHKSPPYVKLERLNFVVGSIPLSNLSFPVTENVEISKSPQKKTKIKEKNIIPHIVKELNGTSSNQRSFKNDELCSSNENHTSCNNNLCDINSASSLFSHVNEKTSSDDICTEAKDNEFLSVILDASVISDAFEFYKWHKKLQNLPSSSISTNDFPVHNLANSNQLSSEADNSSNELSLVESGHEIVTSELHLGVVIECITTASDSSAGTDSNSVIKSPARGRICSQSSREKVGQKTEALSMDKDADFSNGILGNFQNDNDLDLKICDVRGDCSDEVIQYLMEDHDQINMLINEMSINTENENHSYVSNDEQDLLIEHESTEQSCESLEKADVVSISGSNKTDSNQPFNPPLNCNISGVNSLTVNEESNRVFSVEKPDALHRYMQSPDDKESGASIASEHTNDVHEKISVVADEPSQNIVDNATNDSSEFERVSFTKPDEQNSSSKGFYENDILADELDYEPSEAMGHYETDMLGDELDYEPSEASEMDMSETESCSGEIQAKQSHSDSKIPAHENPTDAIEVREIQPDSGNNKILKDSFTGQHVRDSFFIRQEHELDNSSQLCNANENSSDKDSMESVQNNDAFVNQTTHHSPPNNNDGCEDFQSNPHASYDQANFSNSFVSEHVDALHEKNSETSDTEFDEINNTGHEEKDPGSFQFNKKQEAGSFQFNKKQEVNCYQKQPLRNEAESSQKRSIDSEDDSESDSEHSFKRKISNDNQGFGFNEEENSVDEFSQSKVNSFFGKFEEVLLSIQEKCKNGKIDDAVQIANDYIPISDDSVQKHIFTELFFSLMESFRNSNPPLMEDLCLDTMKNTMGIFYDLNKTEDLYDTALCSDIISECLGLKLTAPYGQQLFAFCQKNCILIDSAAVMSYINTIKPSEMSLTELISFLNFISKCKVPPPKFILKEMMNLLFQNEEDISVSEITEICELLCCVGSSEVDKEDIKKFVDLCIEKRFWTQLARLICACAQKGPLITWVIETALSHLENVGFWYEELAKEIYGPGDNVPLQARFIFGQMGHLLLWTSVLHLERPKDAYMIFKSFSLDLPKEFDETLKLEIRSRRLHYLLKITLALQSKDPLGRGMDALRSLLSAQKDFSLEQLSEYSKDIQVAYNKYMVCILNAAEQNLVKEFYAYSHGPQKELFTLDCQVLRGLIVFFVKHEMLDEAKKLFHLGCLKNIYEFRKVNI